MEQVPPGIGEEGHEREKVFITLRIMNEDYMKPSSLA